MSTATTDDRQTLARSSMASLVGSMADNKAALARRYAEWGVSAPTLESGVAAAAMAQDEMGHARSSYPVVKALGGEVDEDGWGGDRRLALLDGELPDWAAFIAANLIVDGILTTFVASCVESSVEQMAQRAKKILQEEGSHRVHAEAWARRLCRGSEAERSALLGRIDETWEQASRWLGPDEDPGFNAALGLGMVSRSPSEQRQMVSAWLTGMLAEEGVELTLAEPSDWSSWDSSRRRWAA
jgi:phenylacetate-CoA oxygenase PaaI subunit